MNSFQEWISSILAGLGGAAATFFALRRKYSQDSTAIAHDRAESKLITTLMAERDLYMREAQEAHAKEIIAAGRLAHFEALVEAGEKETKRLREELFAMRLHTRKLTAIIVKLDPQAARLLEIDVHRDGIEEGDRGPEPTNQPPRAKP